MARTFMLGDVRVDRIVEREEPFLAARTLFPALTPEELDRHREWLEQLGALVPGTDILTISVHSFVVRTPQHTILIDACIGNGKTFPGRRAWHRAAGTAYLEGLAAAGLRLEDIDVVLCTHLHVDHVGWNTRLVDGRWVPTFPNARYVFARAEYEHWLAENNGTPNPVFIESVLPVVEAGRAILVDGDAAIDDFVCLLPTPGHTPGHVAAVLGGRREEAVVIGDVMHSPLQVLRPDLVPIFDSDPAQAVATRRSLLARLSETGALCCTAHFPAPSVFRVARDNDVFRCEAVR